MIRDDTTNAPPRDVWRALWRGFSKKCPRCGEGSLFRAFLKVNDRCPSCREALHHHRADDAPAYFVILIAGHLIVPLAVSTELEFAPPYWVHAALWGPLTLLLGLSLLQPVKGAIVGLQWGNRMHGFDESERGFNAATQTGCDAR